MADPAGAASLKETLFEIFYVLCCPSYHLSICSDQAAYEESLLQWQIQQKQGQKNGGDVIVKTENGSGLLVAAREWEQRVSDAVLQECVVGTITQQACIY